jgi:gluconolactonase
MHKLLFIIPAIVLLAACHAHKTQTTGSIERIDPALNAIINENAAVEVLAQGYDWAEGPVWIEDQKMLLFSDIPKNSIYKWTEEKGAELYLKPSGYTGTVPRGGEPGSNGLIINKNGELMMCQHGDRRIAVMDASLKDPKPVFKNVVDNFNGKKFNSPNDLVQRSNGDIFFTDPPYGLVKIMADPSKEIPFQGVYKLSPGGKAVLLLDSITRPNGIAFTPDEKTLIIASSDSAKAVWYAYDIAGNDSLINSRIMYDVTKEVRPLTGLPDGLKIDRQGNIFATGPDGIWIFNKAFKLIGKIKLPEKTANCAFADDEKTLYITSHMYLLRLKMR